MTVAKDWLTLKEIDERKGLAKGATFRSFRQLEPGLTEGRDFRLLDAKRDAVTIDALRSAGRIYRSSVNVLLLSPSLARRLLELH